MIVNQIINGFLIDAQGSSTTSSFQNDIHQRLKQVLGSGHFIKSQTHSPYYHTIGNTMNDLISFRLNLYTLLFHVSVDFELRMGRNGIPLAHTDEEVFDNTNEEKCDY